MRAYFKEISLGIVVIVSALYLFWNWRGERGAPMGSRTTESCRSEELTMRDDWLEGRLPQGRGFHAITNWRACGKTIRRGDVVLYRVSAAHEPVARVVAAQPGDRFRLIAVENGWNIEIEEELYMDATGEAAYRFGSPSPPLIRLYEQAHQGLLDSTSLLLLSTKSPGHQDSGSLGVLNTADVTGIVETL